MTRETRAQNKKTEILQAAIEVIYEEKISGAHLRKIAQRAGMSQGNMHYYFPTKEKLFLNLLDYLLEGFLKDQHQTFINRQAGAREKLGFLLAQDKAYIERRKEMLVLLDFIVNGTKYDKLRHKIREVYKRWRSDVASAVEQGVASGDFSSRHCDFMPSMVVAMMDGAALQSLVDDSDFDLSGYFDSFREVLLELLSPGQKAT